MNAHTPLLEIRGLKKSFDFKPVLRGIDLVLNRGQRMALLGANGTGKTTLLRILAALTTPDAGSICIDGLDIVQHAQHIRRLIGFVGHQPYLYDELTAMENLLFFGRMYSVKQTQQRANKLLCKVGLEKRAQERVGDLSRGQVQRLALARALLHSPCLLLLDEPDTGLDEQGNELLEALLHEHIEQNGAVLFSAHQRERALALADTTVILDRGHIASNVRRDMGVAELDGDHMLDKSALYSDRPRWESAQ